MSVPLLGHAVRVCALGWPPPALRGRRDVTVTPTPPPGVDLSQALPRAPASPVAMAAAAISVSSSQSGTVAGVHFSKVHRNCGICVYTLNIFSKVSNMSGWHCVYTVLDVRLNRVVARWRQPPKRLD
jgi:hypothetical protein